MNYPNDVTSLEKNIAIIEDRLRLRFAKKEILISAFIHRSYANENKDLQYLHNERLEFLGDAVLSLIVAEFLYRTLPETPEGELSTLRAMAVSASSCLQYIEKLGLETFILMGKGEQIHGGKGRTTILADLFEAILGAVYLEFGLDEARSFFLRYFAVHLEALIKNPQHNYKALLQEYLQKHMKIMPQYAVLEESGPDHDKHFVIGVYRGDALIGKGSGQSKKEAEQNAAKIALSTVHPHFENEGKPS
jgi:ribonuclease III